MPRLRRLDDVVAGRRATSRSSVDAINYPSGGLLLDDVTVLAQKVSGANDGQIRKLLRRARTL